MKNIMRCLSDKSRLFGIIFVAILLINNFAQAKDYNINELPTLEPESTHSVVARRVTNYFTQSHFRDFNLDGVFSSKIFDRYFKLLDSSKATFIQSDIDSFRVKQTQIGQNLRNGDLSTAFDIYNLSLKKRFARYQYALSLLAQPMDFTVDESIDFKREDMAWPTSEEELNEFWRKKVKYDELSLALSGKNEDEIRTILSKRYNRILRTLIQTKPEDAFQVFMNAFAREIDPHTSYLAPRIKRDFDSEMSLSFEGIGATLTQDDDYTRIVSFVTGGPAERSKQLAVGDRIIGVGQKGKPVEDVIGWRLDDIVEKIRGPKGSIVQLEILPAGNNSQPKVIELARDKIHFEDREAKLSIISTSRGDVGVIDIPSFYIGLTAKVAQLLAEANQKNLKGIVIDLRNNGGGSLAEVISLTGLFIEKGPVVQVKDNMQKLAVYDDKDSNIEYQGPILVMINRHSASASEIFSAALQDYGRAIIVGENSYGKGTVQTSRNIAYPIDAMIHPDWPELGGVQYTIQKFYRINGGSTQLKGVKPDLEMSTLQYVDETGERFLDNALPWDSVVAAKYPIFFDVNSVLPQLIKSHLARAKLSPEFNYIEENIVDYNAKKDHLYVVSLNKAVREAEQKQNDSKTLLRMNERLKRANLAEIKTLDEMPKDFKMPDAYLDEAVEILLDFSQYYIPAKSSLSPSDTDMLYILQDVEIK
ncbi:S41A family C-terminal processing peptidase-1 [Orbus hercynius]|uniref:S41A family C-terminal processing peptidase-1 n=1 Tax=Orbus hercynius TaxID=593135 RepID=A0A495RBC2_9GAMM|nr:carboxy terminal-processing peptidase [Orbus hercynius]RKS84715.1 S41A family C-terminal processing peptidase-1 [Orbus hercynius]